jgi:hypothetical protein
MSSDENFLQEIIRACPHLRRPHGAEVHHRPAKAGGRARGAGRCCSAPSTLAAFPTVAQIADAWLGLERLTKFPKWVDSFPLWEERYASPVSQAPC